MIATTEKIEYGKEIIEFELLQEDRKTLSIEVLPTTKIKVKAPENKNKQDIIKKFKIKQNGLQGRNDTSLIITKNWWKKYVSGESFRYLGKQYRLKVIKSNADSVKLKNGYLVVEYCLKTPAKLINKWYKDKAISTYKKNWINVFSSLLLMG